MVFIVSLFLIKFCLVTHWLDWNSLNFFSFFSYTRRLHPSIEFINEQLFVFIFYFPYWTCITSIEIVCEFGPGDPSQQEWRRNQSAGFSLCLLCKRDVTKAWEQADMIWRPFFCSKKRKKNVFDSVFVNCIILSKMEWELCYSYAIKCFVFQILILKYFV